MVRGRDSHLVEGAGPWRPAWPSPPAACATASPPPAGRGHDGPGVTPGHRARPHPGPSGHPAGAGSLARAVRGGRTQVRYGGWRGRRLGFTRA